MCCFFRSNIMCYDRITQHLSVISLSSIHSQQIETAPCSKENSFSTQTFFVSLVNFITGNTVMYLIRKPIIEESVDALQLVITSIPIFQRIVRAAKAALSGTINTGIVNTCHSIVCCRIQEVAVPCIRGGQNILINREQHTLCLFSVGPCIIHRPLIVHLGIEIGAGTYDACNPCKDYYVSKSFHHFFHLEVNGYSARNGSVSRIVGQTGQHTLGI